MLIGDIHSHVDGAAYASGIDKADEAYRPGLHIVVGRIREEPPEFHCAVTADGMRFPVKDIGLVLEDYQRRRCQEVPEEWIAKVRVEEGSGWKQSARNLSSNTRNEPVLFGSYGAEELCAVGRGSPFTDNRKPLTAGGEEAKAAFANAGEMVSKSGDGNALTHLMEDPRDDASADSSINP
jgi:hypothetical protein